MREPWSPQSEISAYEYYTKNGDFSLILIVAIILGYWFIIPKIYNWFGLLDFFKSTYIYNIFYPDSNKNFILASSLLKLLSGSDSTSTENNDSNDNNSNITESNSESATTSAIDEQTSSTPVNTKEKIKVIDFGYEPRREFEASPKDPEPFYGVMDPSIKAEMLENQKKAQKEKELYDNIEDDDRWLYGEPTPGPSSEAKKPETEIKPSNIPKNSKSRSKAKFSLWD